MLQLPTLETIRIKYRGGWWWQSFLANDINEVLNCPKNKLLSSYCDFLLRGINNLTPIMLNPSDFDGGRIILNVSAAKLIAKTLGGAEKWVRICKENVPKSVNTESTLATFDLYWSRDYWKYPINGEVVFYSIRRGRSLMAKPMGMRWGVGKVDLARVH